MKRLTITLVFAMVSTIGFAQWQINGSNIYYNQGNVGIGVSNPSNKFEISGLEDFADDNRTFIKLINNSQSQNSLVSMRLFSGVNGSFTSLTHLSETYIATSGQADFGQLRSTGAGLILRATSGIIKFETGINGVSEVQMKIDSAGNIGIGTMSPKAKLEIADGDIFISDIEKGIIMKSPDGNCWRGTVDNDGRLNFVQIECIDLITNIYTTQESSSQKISVFPNPTQNYILIKYDENEIKSINYVINDVKGILINKGTLRSTNEIIETTFLKEGIYFITVFDKNGNKLTTEKIVKK